jgi:iron complex transport system ATP-binding protein
LDLIVSGKYASIGVFEKPAEDDYRLAYELAGQLNCEKILNSSYGVLSQGEKQRLLIARAIIHRPRLLILDEPCAGLDLVAREQLLRTLDRLTRVPDAPTLIFVTHHLEEIIPVFTHVFILKGGKCVAKGKREDVLRADLLSDAFGIPLDLTADGSRYWARATSWEIPD